MNPDSANKVGVSMQVVLDGMSFVTPMETKKKVKNLSCLRKPVKVSDTSIVIDSFKLFNRLILITERKGSVQEALKFELTLFPLSLFDNKQCMRKPQKAVLGKYLKAFSGPQDRDTGLPIVIDGGWLLHQCNFESGELFQSIIRKFLQIVLKLGSNKHKVVVFDGYKPSPKDHEHARRQTGYSADVSLSEDTPCTMSKTRFLANTKNKSQLILLLKDLFVASGIKVVLAEDDADTLIVQEALKIGTKQTLEVRAEDTDILCMFVHHLSCISHDILFTTQTGSYSIRKIRDNIPKDELDVLLLSHAFSGSDTTSSICGFGKVRILKRFADSGAPKECLNTLNELRSSKDRIGKAGIVLVQFLYGQVSTPLHQIRFDRYNKSMAKGKFLSQKLPPTEGAVIQHTLRVYLQCHDWILLKSQSLVPVEYGWRQDPGCSFEPVGSMCDVAPAAIPNFTTCNCRVDLNDPACRNDICSCRRHGLPCLPFEQRKERTFEQRGARREGLYKKKLRS